MKTALYRLLAALLLSGTAVSAQAAVYICNGTFSDRKLGPECFLSQMDGSGSAPAEKVDNVQPVEPDLKQKPGELAESGGDVTVLPQKGGSSVTNSAEAANPKLDVRLRNGGKSAKAKAAEANRRAKIVPAPTIPAPPVKPKVQLTRAQILNNEVKNEKTALVRAKAQLSAAKRKGSDAAKIQRLEQTVRDRQANIRAIEGEMKR
ncbi:hypothetical protein [Neisseria sp.]|uniref:hypothetical protein n=1 Tax=Neisseria sp. TaxID=192066 RepID=UPI0035A17F5C